MEEKAGENEEEKGGKGKEMEGEDIELYLVKAIKAITIIYILAQV